MNSLLEGVLFQMHSNTCSNMLEQMNDLKNIVSKEKESSAFGVVAVLLNQKNGLISLMSKLNLNKQDNYEEIIKCALLILENLLERFRGLLDLNHLVVIKDFALIHMNSKTYILRGASFCVVGQVIITAHALTAPPTQVLKELNLSALSNILFEKMASDDSSSKVKMNFLVLIGRLAYYFPSTLKEKASRIINQLLYELEKEVKRQHHVYEDKRVGGCIEALAGFLHSFNSIVDQKYREKIHDYLLLLINRFLLVDKRSHTKKAALNMLAEHASLFNLVKNYKSWFENLKSYALFEKKDVLDSGLKALGKFIEEVVKSLKSEVDATQKSIILEFFVKSVTEILESDQASLQLRSVSLKALGECSFLVSDTNASYIFEFLLNKTAFICIQEENTSNNLDLLPICVESIGLVLMRYNSPIGLERTQQLQKMLLHLFSRYLDIGEQHRCGRAVAVFLVGARIAIKNPLHFSAFAREIIIQSLIRSTRPELDSDSLKKYTSLWITILNFSRQTDLPFGLEDRVRVSEVLDAQLIIAISTVIDRLNFTMNEVDDSTVEGEKNGSCPQNPADWVLFHNLVDLLEDVLKAVEPRERLQDLLIPFGVEVIELSTKFPFIPGLYRIVASVLFIIGSDLAVIHHSSYQFYMSSLINRLSQLSDDVHVSAVQAVLSSPPWLVTSVSSSVTGALISALKIGLTFPPMAEWPLNALEHWQTTLSFSIFDPIMENILPFLEPYLSSVEKLTKEVPFISGKRLTRSATNATHTIDREAWLKVQRRVVKLLGRMGPKCSRLVHQNEDHVIAHSATGWQISGHLEFGLPLSDMKPVIQLDAFLPRILHLVQFSSESETRMAACEFLHAAIIFLTGTVSRHTEEIQQRYPLTALYSKLFPVILNLAVDSEEVIRQLFHTLLIQLVHWFSRPFFCRKKSMGCKTILGAETVLLLEHLIESACSGLDTSLVRDLACDCLVEFLKWNIKQSSNEILWEDPAVPDFLFQKLRSSATHSLQHQRRGAAIVVNKLYRVMRESEPLLSIYTLDLLTHFVVGLSLAEKDSTLETLHETKKVLQNLTRTVILKRSFFENPDARRRIAPLMTQGTLSELLDILLHHIFGSQKHCRQICVELCEILARPQSLSEVIKKFLSKHPQENLLPCDFSWPARLDVYRILLRLDVIEASICDTDSNNIKQFEVFVKNIEKKLDAKSYDTEGSLNDTIIETFMAWIGFLAEYLRKSQSYTFLHVGSLVRTSLLLSKEGFSFQTAESRKQLYTCLETQIFPLLNRHEETIRSILTSAEFQLDSLNFADKKNLDIVQGLVVIASSGCMGTNVSFCKSPTVLLKMAVDNIICNDAALLNRNGINIGADSFSVRLKASSMLIELALLLGLNMEILANEFRNPANIPDSSVTYGQYLRAKLGNSVLSVVVRQIKIIQPFLPQLGNSDPQQWTLLLELLQKAHQYQDLEKRKWIVQNVLNSWSVLERHAEDYRQKDYLRLIVNCILNMDVDLVGRNNDVKRWIINSWNPNTDVNFASEMVQLLIIFINNYSDSEEKSLTSSLCQFLTHYFPSKTTALEKDSDKSAYFSIINRMIVLIRVPVVFHFLVDVFALEPHHSCIPSFIKSVQNENWEKFTCANSLNRALTKLYHHAKLRTINPKTRIDEIDILYVPLLTVLPSSVVEYHINELLVDVLQMYEDTRTGVELCIQKTVLCALVSVAIVRVGYQRLSTYLNANFQALKVKKQLSDDGKSLLKCLMQFALNIQKIRIPANSNEVEIIENLQRVAFKLTLSIVTVTPALDVKRVDRLIFRPMNKANTLWNAVVGTVERYNLIIEMERHRKRFLVHIPTISEENGQNKGRYIPSQFFFGSSLSEDVNRFDFNQASFSTNFGSYDETRNPSVLSPANEASSSLLYLTLDDLNKHPCMGLLVDFLEKFYSKQTASADSEPEWMKSLRESLLNPSAHTNVVLFIVRLVINLKSIFQPYAKFWYKSLLIVLFRKIGGEPLNNLFRDGLDVMFEWSKIKPPSVDDKEFAQAASSVIQFILKNIDNANQEILRDNMAMIKAFFAVWYNISLDIPYEIVEGLLFSDKKKSTLLGLQILDVIAMHGFLPKNLEQKSHFKQRLANILVLDECRALTRSCAALCGSILFRETDDDFEKLICDKIQMWHNKNKDDVFIDLLYEVTVTSRYRAVLSKFATINLSLLGSVYGTLKTRCLEMLAISWHYMEDPWKEIGLKTIESILKGSNHAELCPILSLVKDLIPRLEIKDWKPLWPRLVRLSRHENIECRSRLYEIFKKAFDLSDPRDTEFSQAILRACTDQDKELAAKMQNFLAEKLPDSTMDRLLVYLTDFYAPGSEDYFLPYSAHFLLERTVHSHLYRESIFDQPLDDIPFQLLDLASLSSQSLSHQQSRRRGFCYGSIQPGFLRATLATHATQSMNRDYFSPTPSSTNWLMAETQSAGPSFVSQVEIKTPSQRIVKETLKSPVKSWKRFISADSPSVKSNYENPVKCSGKMSNQPTLYRKYRIGDLPDIQIPPSSLIAPLCAVALNDAAIAKTLFCHLISAFRKQIKEIQGDDCEFALKLNSVLESILERHEPRKSNFNLLAAIIEYFWTNSVDITNTAKIVQLVKASHIQSLGILVIESYLPDCLVLEHYKKPRSEQMKHESSEWFYVADLYGDIKDVDNVRAVVTHLTDCKDTTKKAIQSETKHDWNKAFQYYSQLGGDASSPAEMKFCREYGFKCLEELGRWDDIRGLKPKTEPWNIRSHVRASLKNLEIGRTVKGLDSVHLPSINPALLTDLAALALCNGNRDRAVTCISKATDEFISGYSQLSPLNFGGRQNLLQHVCIITEIETFLHQSDITSNLSFPQTGDNVVVWDEILALRTFFAQRGKNRNNLAQVKSLRLQLAAVALEQKNFGLSRKLVDATVDIHEPGMRSLFYLMQSKVLAMESLTFDVALNQLSGLMSAKETINRANISTINNSEEVLWEIDRERFEACLSAQVFQVMNNVQPKDLITMEAKLIELWNVPPRKIINDGLQHAEQQAKLAEIQGITANMAEAYFILAKYFYKWKTTKTDEDYKIGLTRSVLSSMRYGSVDGQALFPLVILVVKDNNSSATAVFQQLRSNVPIFMFLPWVNQLVSYFAMSLAIAKLLIDISERYPVHVRLPFGITRSTLSLEVLKMYEVCSLEAKLATNDPTWKMFLKSLDYLKPPERAALELLNSETCTADFELFKSIYLNLPPPTANSSYGRVHHSFSVMFTSKFQEAFNNGRLNELSKLLNSLKNTLAGPGSLREYSPWLANYRLGDTFSNGLLELPGFKGETLKVEAFRDEIRYFPSKQFPVQLILVVNGAVEYPVLVKHGEDVRQDERIIQLLNAIDVVLMRDVESKKRSLRIRTFQVIPLTNSCGIFQWLKDTLTLKAFLELDLDYCSSSIAVKEEARKVFPSDNVLNYFMNNTQKKLMNNYSKLADRSYRYGLRGALKKLSQSPEAFFYLRNRLAMSHGSLCSALWTLGVGDRHLSNFLVSTKTGDIISIDYGMAFGMATAQLFVPEIVPCRLTAQFQFLIPGIGLSGSIRESMIHTLRVTKEESGSIIAALSVFVTEPTLDWVKHAERIAKRSRNGTLNHESTDWSPVEVVLRTENLLNGFHPSKITCDDLERNRIFSTTEGRKLLPLLVSAVQGISQSLTVDTNSESVFNKRKIEGFNTMSCRASMPKQELSSDQQIECLIEQSTDPACLCRMYWGWEPWM